MKIPMALVDAVRKSVNARVHAGLGTEQQLTGLTLRVGRPMYGACFHIEDMLERCTSTLLIGQAGVGKSTILREMSRCCFSTRVRVECTERSATPISQYAASDQLLI